MRPARPRSARSCATSKRDRSKRARSAALGEITDGAIGHRRLGLGTEIARNEYQAGAIAQTPALDASRQTLQAQRAHAFDQRRIVDLQHQWNALAPCQPDRCKEKQRVTFVNNCGLCRRIAALCAKKGDQRCSRVRAFEQHAGQSGDRSGKPARFEFACAVDSCSGSAPGNDMIDTSCPKLAQGVHDAANMHAFDMAPARAMVIEDPHAAPCDSARKFMSCKHHSGNIMLSASPARVAVIVHQHDVAGQRADRRAAEPTISWVGLS